MKYEENDYIMTSIELDEQFVDNMADLSINDPEYMTDEERDEANDLDLADEETEEEAYQMTDEEQKGCQDHITEERREDPLVENLINIIAGYSTIEEIEQAIAEERAEEKAKRLDAGRRAKENQRLLERNPHMKSVIDDNTIQNLNNHFNA